MRIYIHTYTKIRRYIDTYIQRYKYSSENLQLYINIERERERERKRQGDHEACPVLVALAKHVPAHSQHVQPRMQTCNA